MLKADRIVYIADDGQEFKTPLECLKHEMVCELTKLVSFNVPFQDGRDTVIVFLEENYEAIWQILCKWDHKIKEQEFNDAN